ncbi:MAG: fatty acyl-AMP ligase [Alphaproteobacteria bacterium]|nr:MAG: fatty acyl-AMP ligase [Alphaproteobacteria bacterium]
MEPFSSLLAVLEHRAATQGDERALVFLTDRGAEDSSLTFRALHDAAHSVAQRLAAVAQPGDRALLVFPPGLEFVIAFFGCLIARVIAVPMMVPRRQSARDSSASIMGNCKPAVALTSPGLAARDDLVARFAGHDLHWLTVDLAPGASDAIDLPRPRHDDIAFLQYTSGSTSEPKGVVVTHAMLLANMAMAQAYLGTDRHSTCVNWVPHYHDMGLILSIVGSLYLGALCVLVSPSGFMQRPLIWLRAVSDYKGVISAAPNFAYDLCVARLRADQMEGVDLSSWKITLSGAEPIRAATIEKFVETFGAYGFKPTSINPGFGMAEATLIVAMSPVGAGHDTRTVSRAAMQANIIRAPDNRGDAHVLVGCGYPVPDSRLAIVDPQTLRRLPADTVGELWINGPHVASAYWGNPAASAASLHAHIDGEDGDWLRSGDLGFLDTKGQLFITGRIKDLIIVRGMNHYPQDIELTVERAHAALRQNGGAAFSVPDERGEETLVVVQEVERTARNRIDPEEITGVIREAVTQEHEVFARHIVLIRPQTLPKTTSGKVQRALTRKLWLEGKLDYLTTEPAA